jgi:Fe-S-cluster containining protein
MTGNEGQPYATINGHYEQEVKEKRLRADMAHSNSSDDENLLIDSPAYWDEDTLHHKWKEFLQYSASQSEITMPVKRLQSQVERSTAYLEIIRGWHKMNGSARLSAWKRLLEAVESIVQEILPACVQCGECCRKASPTLHEEDLELLQQGKIPWGQLVTLREGEPAYSPFDEKPFFLPSECIKIREKSGSSGCVFLNDQTTQCVIYRDRPVQCRAQTCWEPAPAQQLAKAPHLTRRGIFEEVELLRDIIAEHDQRCSFKKLSEAFAELAKNKPGGVDRVLELMAYEDHFRDFFAERLNIPEDTLDLVFGRSFADLAPLFGFRHHLEPDGTRCLILENH